MRKMISTVFCLILALPILMLEAVFGIVLILRRLWKKQQKRLA